MNAFKEPQFQKKESVEVSNGIDNLSVFLLALNKKDAYKYGKIFKQLGVKVFSSPVYSNVADAVIVIAENEGDLDSLAKKFNDFTRAPCVAFFGPTAFDVGFT